MGIFLTQRISTVLPYPDLSFFFWMQPFFMASILQYIRRQFLFPAITLCKLTVIQPDF